MRSVVAGEFGEADVLAVVDAPVPEPSGDQVTIDVTHASVTLADVLLRRGRFGGEPPVVPGLEVAGVVRAVGAEVAGLRPGDPVVTLSRPTAGGYAEVSSADAGVTIPIGDLDPALAVVTVPNAVTSLLALGEVAHLPVGGRVLIHGALGALSLVAAQVARSLGAGHVAGTVRRSSDSDTARDAGYDEVIVASELIDDPGEHTGFHVVLDPVGGPLRAASVRTLAPLGCLVALGDASGESTSVDPDDLWLGNAAIAGLNAGGLLATHPERATDAARHAVELVTSGAVAAEYDVLALDDAAEAHRRLESGGQRRRLVLRP